MFDGGIAVERRRDHGAQLGQRHPGRGEMRGARWHLAAGAAGRLADERLRPFDRCRGNAGPDRRPAEMSNWRHGLRVNLVIGFWKYLFGRAGRLQFEAGAAGAAHAERFPFEAAAQRVIVFGKGHQHLIGGGGIVGAAGDGDDAVGLRAIGNHGGVAQQRNAGVGAFDGGGAGADVAAVLAFGRRGRQQQLFGRYAAHQRFMPRAAGSVPDQAGDLGLMHRKDHRGGGAGATQRIAHVGDVEDRCAVAAERDRDLGAEKFLLARRVDRGFREARITIDIDGLLCGDRGDGRCPLHERGGPRSNCSLMSSAAESRSLASCTFMPVCLQGSSVRSACAEIASRCHIDRHDASDRGKAKDLIQMRR